MELHDRRDQKDDGRAQADREHGDGRPMNTAPLRAIYGPSADERGLQGYLLTKIAKSDQDTNGEGHPTEGGAEQ